MLSCRCCQSNVVAKELDFKLIIGSEFNVSEGLKLVAIAPSRAAYGELSNLISRRGDVAKGQYLTHLRDIYFHPSAASSFGCQHTLTRRNTTLTYCHADSLTVSGLGLRSSYTTTTPHASRVTADCLRTKGAAHRLWQCGDALCRRRCCMMSTPYDTTVQCRLGKRRSSNSQQHLRRLDKLLPLYPLN